MFWSLVLEPNRRYSSTVREPFHLSMATLDIKSVKNDQELFPVLLKFDGKDDSILCNLSKSSFPQVPLDLNFERGTKIGFFTNGSATVHLTGYLLDEDLSGGDSSDEDSSEASSESTDEVSVNKGKGDMKPESLKKNKRKSEEILNEVSKKKSKSKSGDDGSKNGLDMRMKTLNDSKGSDSDEDDDDEFDDDDDLDDLDLSDLGSSADLSSDDDDGDDDDDDEEDDDDEDDEDDDDSEDSEKTKPQKTPQQSPKKKPDEKTPKQGKNVQNQTPSSNKKQGKQNLSLLNGAVTPKSDKKAKNTDTPQQKQGGGNKGTPQQKQGGINKDTPQQKQGGNNKGTPQQQKPGGSPKKQTLPGGVQIEELKTGNGPVAKPGKMVSVYYTGRLKTNNRVFDQKNSGPGFKFRLGQGEVVKGYDIGISGMTVGSKRRITIPPNMAYGKKGSPPTIPSNATLIFEVELKSVN